MLDQQEAIHQKYYPLVLLTCKRRLNRIDDIDDAVQSTFLLYLENKPNRPSSLGSWFYWASVNICQYINNTHTKDNKYRDKQKLNQIKDSYEEFETNFEILEQVLETLSESKRSLLLMRYYDQLSYKEIGTHYNCSEDSIRKKNGGTIAEKVQRHCHSNHLINLFKNEAGISR